MLSSYQTVLAQNFNSQRMVDSLIAAYSKPYPNDSARVNIINKLGEINRRQEFGCRRCVQFLIEKVDARFSYGDGISEFDQANSRAAQVQLIGIVHYHPNRWRVLQDLFDALKTKDRNEKYLHNIYFLFKAMSGNSVSKAIIEFEISSSGSDPNYKLANPSYLKNLKTLLGMFD